MVTPGFSIYGSCVLFTTFVVLTKGTVEFELLSFANTFSTTTYGICNVKHFIFLYETSLDSLRFSVCYQRITLLSLAMALSTAQGHKN